MAADCNAEQKEKLFIWAVLLHTFEKLCIFFTGKCIISFRKNEEQSFQGQDLWCHCRMTDISQFYSSGGNEADLTLIHQKHRKLM